MNDPSPDDRCTVWVAAIPAATGHLARLLDDAEHARQSAFRSVDDSDRFTSAAALLRIVAGSLSGRTPEHVRVVRTCSECGRPHGRPHIVDDAHPPFDVSLSHAGRFVAVAVTSRGRVGVDIEQVSGIRLDLVDAVCTPTERRWIADPHDLATTWVRKEAVLKADGSGLRIPPGEVEVSAPGLAPVLVAFRNAEPPPCRIADLRIDAAHVGAVAILGSDARRPVEQIDATDWLAEA